MFRCISIVLRFTVVITFDKGKAFVWANMFLTVDLCSNDMPSEIKECYIFMIVKRRAEIPAVYWTQ